MLNYTISILANNGFTLNNATILANILLFIFAILLCVIIKVILNKIILSHLTEYVKKTKQEWDDVLLNRKVFNRLSDIFPPLVFYIFIPVFSGEFHDLARKFMTTYITLVVMMIIVSILHAITDIYDTREFSKGKTIKGLMQVFHILTYIVGTIIIISSILGTSPMIILSGVGALTAVLLIVFKDSLQGLASGIQITTNDMLRVGDLVEMPQYETYGHVVDISLNTIKVKNFDQTISNIPSYSFISDSFKNWRNTQEVGGRKIKRAIYIDITSIKFCDEQMLEKFKKISLVADYITNEQKQMDEFNKSNGLDNNYETSRRLTNLGIFRVYIEQYLNNNPHIHQKLFKIVRELDPDEFGIPLEVYAFSNTADWFMCERIQSNLFEHLIAVANSFDIRIYQSPSSIDIEHIKL